MEAAAQFPDIAMMPKAWLCMVRVAQLCQELCVRLRASREGARHEQHVNKEQ
jgi:hypothetical protein